MNRVVWQIQVMDLIGKEVAMLQEHLPVVSGDPIVQFAAVDNCKFEGSIDEGVRVGQASPLAEGRNPFGGGILGRVG